MRWHTNVLALCATAAIAWGAVPEPPAAYSVRDVAQLSMVMTVGGRSRSMSRRIASNGRIEIGSAETLRIAEPRGFFTDPEATWTRRGRNALRFTFTPESRAEVLDQFESALGLARLASSARGRFGAGRLVFTDGARRVHGTQLTRVTLAGRYAGRRFNVWVTVRTTWNGTRTE